MSDDGIYDVSWESGEIVIRDVKKQYFLLLHFTSSNRKD